MVPAILKIAARISTMTPETTMTTNLQVERVVDVFAKNDVFRIPTDARSVGLRLAGVAWLATGERPHEAHLRSLEHAVSLLRARLTHYSLWLLACHSAWQFDSRMVRHRKLWASLKAGGLAMPFGREAGEGFIERPGGVRFFGALQLGLGSLAPVAAILEAERASHLVALKEKDEAVAKSLVRRGWDRPSMAPNADVVAAVCRADGVVFWPLGAFDDRESGCVALAKPDVIDQLVL